MRLPISFISRLGELSQTNLSTDTVATLNKVQQALVDVETFGCGIAEGTIPELMAPKMDEKVHEGLNFHLTKVYLKYQKMYRYVVCLSFQH
jgi:hypothetical protein